MVEEESKKAKVMLMEPKKVVEIATPGTTQRYFHNACNGLVRNGVMPAQ